MNAGQQPASGVCLLHAAAHVSPGAVVQWGVNEYRQRHGMVARPCLVPGGLPLFEFRSAVENVELLARLTGRPCDRATALHGLRCAELPDAAHRAHGRSLTAVNRLSIWLAVVRLTDAQLVVFLEPLQGLDRDGLETGARLVREAASPTRLIVVSSSDRSWALPLMATVAGGANWSFD